MMKSTGQILVERLSLEATESKSHTLNSDNCEEWTSESQTFTEVDGIWVSTDARYRLQHPV